MRPVNVDVHDIQKQVPVGHSTAEPFQCCREKAELDRSATLATLSITK